MDAGANLGDTQFVRLNFATSPELLRHGLKKMADAVEKLQKSAIS